MQVSLETTEGLGRKLTIGLPAADIDQAIEERLKSLRKTARINGFRPGKVPMQVLRKRYALQVRSEVLGQMINRSYFDAVREQNLKPAGDPTIEADEHAGGDEQDGFSYTATFEVYPEFEPNIAGIAIERPVVDISESDIDNTIEQIREQRSEFVKVEREAAEGDQIEIDFVGRLDGESEPFEGGSAEHVPLELGSGRMIPGFEGQLVGMRAGEQRVIELNFPEDYQAEHLAGKKAFFDINLREVRSKQAPPLDEDFVRSVGVEDGAMESLRADVRKNMQTELDRRIELRLREQAFDGLVEQNPIAIPAALVASQIRQKKEQMAGQLPPEFDIEQLGDEMFRAEAEKQVRLGLVLGEIIKREKLEASDEQVRARIEQMAATYEEPQQVFDYYYNQPEMRRNIEGLVIEQQVADRVMQQGSVSDKPMSFDQFMRPEAEPVEAEPVEAGATPAEPATAD